MWLCIFTNWQYFVEPLGEQNEQKQTKDLVTEKDKLEADECRKSVANLYNGPLEWEQIYMLE